MRIFYAFLLLFCAAILFFLVPFTDGPYAFKTDLREDSFTVVTGSTTNATVQLFKDIYDDDVHTLDIDSDNVTDVPLYNSFDATTRALVITGLSANTTRTITVTYDIDALPDIAAIATLLDYSPFWLFVLCVLFCGAAVALVVIEIIKRYRV